MRRTRNRTLAVAVGGTLVAGVLLPVATAAPASATTPSSTTFTYTGMEQTYAVPSGTTALTVTAVSGSGSTRNSHGVGGPGSQVSATVPLPSSITTVYVEVGGSAAGGSFIGGWNGGGNADEFGDGGGGGGASDVRTVTGGTDPGDPAGSTSLQSRLVVAGGGGGGGDSTGSPSVCNGGAAGDVSVTGAGAGGDAASDSCASGGNGGLGGSAGGPGGVGNDYDPIAGINAGCRGSAGALGRGGGRGGGVDGCGGGGGGGYYGGGGGAGTFVNEGGGGAGSSYWVSSATGTSLSTAAGTATSVTITPVITDAAVHVVRTVATADKKGNAAAGIQFTDDDPRGNLSQYSGTIDWGDGTTSAIPAGSFVRFRDGSFGAGGLHHYPARRPTTYTVRITISDIGGASVTGTTTVTAPSH